MTKTIEQLTARIAELEDVEYLGPYVKEIKVLKTQLSTLTRQRDDLLAQVDLAVEALKRILADDYENDFLSFDLFDIYNKILSIIKKARNKCQEDVKHVT